MYGTTIESLQKAAVDPSLWPDALEALSRETGSAGAILIPIEDRLPGLLSTPNMQDVLGGYFEGGWHLRDERYRGVPIMMRKGVTSEDDFIAPQEIARSAYYRDFLERYGLRWFAGVGFKLNGELWCVALQRRIDQGPFLAQETARLQSLLVPLHDSAIVSQRLALARASGMLDAITAIDRPAVVLDGKARIIAINDIAETILSQSIDTRNARLHFRDPRSNENIRQMITKAIKRAPRSPHDASTIILDDRDASYLVRAVALGDWADLQFAGARVLLILRALRVTPVDPTLLRSHFGLTPAEARLASAVSAGLSLQSVADALGITYETARSRIKDIYEKTNTPGRARLMSLLAKLEL